MKYKIFSILFLIILISGSVYSQGVNFTILHFNDSHSHLDATGPKDENLNGTIGGIARISTLVQQTRQTEQNVMVLHAGDFCVGDFFYNTYFGVPELQILKSIGVDAMTVGNHEFDLTPYVLLGTFQNAFTNGSFPVLSANLDLSSFTPLAQYIFPSIKRNVSGVSVGIFGLTIPNDQNNPYPVVVRTDLVGIAQQTVNNLKNSGANVVILLSHAGLDNDRIIAANINDIDFIIGGHDHAAMQQPLVIQNPQGKNVYIVQAGNFYHNAGKLKFNYNNGVTSFSGYQLINLDQNILPEPVVQNTIEQLKNGIVNTYGQVYSTVLGISKTFLSKNIDMQAVNKDSPLGNLITDAYRWSANTHFAITATGLISESIYEGPVIPADVFRALPYGYDTTNGLGFRVVRFDIRGSELIRGLELGLSLSEFSEDYYLQVSGLNFKYSSNRPAYNRIIPGSLRLDTTHLLDYKFYACAVDEGVYMLLKKYGISVSNVSYHNNCYTVLYDYFTYKDTVEYVSEGRIIDVSKINPTSELQQKNNFGIKGNYPNPFNPATTIAFRIPEFGYSRLEIYDITGRLVSVLFEGNLLQGDHELLWNAGALPSGIYFCKLTSLGYSDVKKIMLVK